MAQKRRNILLITSDQQHWNTLGCLNPEVKTPHLDKLAAEGTLFQRAYTVNPTCTPARSSIITGEYPSRHGAWSLGTKLPETARTVGDDLQRAGYRTALVGKAHFQQLHGTDEFPSIESYPIMQDLDYWRRFNGPFYGFERVELARNHVDEAHVGQHYAIWMEENGLKDWRRHFRDPEGKTPPQKHKWTLPEEHHYNAWIAERTNALMEEYRGNGEPFFLWASFFDPHPAYLAPEPWDAMYDPASITVPKMAQGELDDMPPHYALTQQAKPDFSPWRETGFGMHGFGSHLRDPDEHAKDVAVYYGMVSLLDKYVGRIMDNLDAQGLAEDTLVVFTTDHGHFYGQHGLVAKGAFHYEDMIRIPWVVRCPGHVPAGVRSDALQSLVDLAPTFLNAANVPVPRTMQGVDQTSVWTGECESVREHVVVENRHEPTTIHLKTYVDERHKLTVYYNRPYGELFDLKEDPGELVNLWDKPECRELRAELVQKLLFAEMGKEPLWMPRTASA